MRTPLSNRPKITKDDILRGYVARYFVQHVSIPKIVEVDKNQHELFKRDPYYKTITINWIIGGYAYDIVSVNGNFIYGAAHQNTVSVNWYTKTMNGLDRLLSNPLEYFQGIINDTIVTPINSQPEYSSTLGSSVGFGRTFGNEIVPPPAPTPPTSSVIQPDYWWRADSGLTTSAWSASNGGLDFTLSNVTTASSELGVVFNGTNGFGQTPLLANNIAATHVLLRLDSIVSNTDDAIMGGTQNNIHEIAHNAAGFWNIVDAPNTGVRYGVRTNTNIISPAPRALWFDFTNGSDVDVYTDANSSVKASMARYTGTYNDLFTWLSGYRMYLGRRQQVSGGSGYMRMRVKELAIFTSSLSYEEVDAFRTQMLARWDVPTTLTLSPTVVNFEFTQSASVPSTQYVIITEASGATATGLTIQSQSSWVSASLNTTSTPASMSVIITTTNLATGSYTSSITVSSSVSAISSTVVLPVTASVTSSAGTGSYTALDIAAAELSYYVLRSDNTLWSWGYNGSGELGLGDWDDRPASPTQVAGSWESISVGAYSLLAIKTDNTLWGTGLNWDGRLGLGDETDRNTMTQVTGTGWEKVSTAIGYGDHTLAVKTNGTLWAWGGNGSGQLGIGSSGSDQLTPVQVGSDTNWSYVHAGYDRSFAIKTNGTLWSWGSNLSTALGQGDSDTNAVYTSPTQIGADTNWTKLSSGWAFTFALKSNGTLWVTGQNISYGFGVGSTDTNLQYNTFTQVGSATDWVDISCGYEQCVARKTDGSIYTWGYNADGELGLGDTTNRESPTQVGTATDWTDISGGFYDALAVKNNVLTYWGWNFNDYLGTGNEPELSPVSLPYSSNILY